MVLTNFIKGVLKNQASLALDRIHNKLKMHTPGLEGSHLYDWQPRELADLLAALCAEEALEFADGGCRLLKK